MVSSESSGKTSSSHQANSEGTRRGHCMMGVVMLLLLYVPAAAAVGVRHTQRSQTDTISSVDSLHKTEFVTEDTHIETPSTASDSETTDSTRPAVPALLNNIFKSIRARSRRGVQKGCQFGTCQVHNLANTLYVMGQSNGKEQSKKAADPNGYGR